MLAIFRWFSLKKTYWHNLATLGRLPLFVCLAKSDCEATNAVWKSVQCLNCNRNVTSTWSKTTVPKHYAVSGRISNVVIAIVWFLFCEYALHNFCCNFVSSLEWQLSSLSCSTFWGWCWQRPEAMLTLSHSSFLCAKFNFS